MAFLMISAPVCAAPEPKPDWSELLEPPADAPAGEKHDGVQIGLWTEKPVYEGNEIRNVWMLARSDRSSAITIGVGGSLFQDSFLYITSNDKNVAKIPLNGGIDGIVNPTEFCGGLSGLLAKLPLGKYELIWRTGAFTSNRIVIEIK